MLRLIFTMMSTMALLMLGAFWLAAQPSGGEVRALAAPVLERGLDLAGDAARTVVTALGSELRSTAEADARRVPLTPTASGVWEPEDEPTDPPDASTAVPEPAPKRAPEPAPKRAPERRAPARPAPEPVEEDEVEEVVLAARVPFTDAPLPEEEARAAFDEVESAPDSAAASRPAPPLAAAARPNQDEWAALIRRMLSVQSRVRGVE